MVTALQHVLVLTDDIDASRDFYRDVVGMSEGARPPLAFPGHWLYAGRVPCLHIADRVSYAAHSATLGLAVRADGRPGGAVDHLAFSADDYDGVVDRLAHHGLTPVPNLVPGVQRQLFFDDPNGVRVELNFALDPS